MIKGSLQVSIDIVWRSSSLLYQKLSRHQCLDSYLVDTVQQTVWTENSLQSLQRTTARNTEKFWGQHNPVSLWMSKIQIFYPHLYLAVESQTAMINRISFSTNSLSNQICSHALKINFVTTFLSNSVFPFDFRSFSLEHFSCFKRL